MFPLPKVRMLREKQVRRREHQGESQTILMLEQTATWILLSLLLMFLREVNNRRARRAQIKKIF
ncbi:MAG: hypothetical protein GY696_36910 [Gammaproteobacteria bacterium]|nr:hypothetical protein [Gammaproteobacteria bacterium]